HKAYVHRSGRTARGGAEGTVVTVQTAAQVTEVRTLTRQAGVSPQAAIVDPCSAVPRSIAAPGQAHDTGGDACPPGAGQRSGHRPRCRRRVRSLPGASRLSPPAPA